MPEEQQQQQEPQQQEQKPPWGDDFDAEKAWKLVQNLREDNSKLKGRPALTDEQKARLEEFDRIEQAAKSDLDKANEQLSRWQTEAEKWRSTSVSSTIKALASVDFEYPEDAVNQLDPAKYLDAGGTIDEHAIKRDLDALLESRPNWRRGSQTDSGPRPPRPNPHQGASAGGRTTPDPAQEFAAFLQQQLHTA